MRELEKKIGVQLGSLLLRWGTLTTDCRDLVNVQRALPVCRPASSHTSFPRRRIIGVDISGPHLDIGADITRQRDTTAYQDIRFPRLRCKKKPGAGSCYTTLVFIRHSAVSNRTSRRARDFMCLRESVSRRSANKNEQQKCAHQKSSFRTSDGQIHIQVVRAIVSKRKTQKYGKDTKVAVLHQIACFRLRWRTGPIYCSNFGFIAAISDPKDFSAKLFRVPRAGYVQPQASPPCPGARFLSPSNGGRKASHSRRCPA